MSEDRITCTICGLFRTIPGESILNKNNYKKFPCPCQNVPLGHRYLKCSRHNYGLIFLESHPEKFQCPECRQDELTRRAPVMKLESTQHGMNSITGPTIFEMEQLAKKLEDKK